MINKKSFQLLTSIIESGSPGYQCYTMVTMVTSVTMVTMVTMVTIVTIVTSVTMVTMVTDLLIGNSLKCVRYCRHHRGE